MATFNEFAAANKITLKTELLGKEIPLWGGTKQSFKWKVEMHWAEKAHTLEFYTGLLNVGFPIYGPGRPSYGEPRKPIDWRMLTWNERRDYEKGISFGLFRKPQPIPPTINDVFSCLVMDSWSYENAPLFKDWANEVGYSSDSIQAKKIHTATRKNYYKLKKFFGETKLKELMGCQES